MEIALALKILYQYQQWLRGNTSEFMYSQTQLTNAITSMIDFFTSLENRVKHENVQSKE